MLGCVRFFGLAADASDCENNLSFYVCTRPIAAERQMEKNTGTAEHKNRFLITPDRYFTREHDMRNRKAA